MYVLVVVGIIGILAAVGIPAYQKYQIKAETGVVKSTVNQVKKAFQICMSVNNIDTCRATNVDGTIEVDGDLTLSPVEGAKPKSCWKVAKGSEFTGCVGFNGRVYKTQGFGFPTDTNCTLVTPTCNGATLKCAGGCTPSAGACTQANPGDPWVLPTNPDCGSGNTVSQTTANCTSGDCVVN